MSLKPKTQGADGARGGSRKPQSRKGQYSTGPDGKLKNRCTCCGLEGDAVPQKAGTNPTLLGLHMGGHLEPNKRKAEWGPSLRPVGGPWH